MRILFINQFYSPDTAATAQLLGDLATGLHADGHEVHVICGAAAYNPNATQPPPSPSQEVQVHRVGGSAFRRTRFGGRLLDYLAFHRAAARCIPSLPRPDVVIALTTPPYIGRLGAAMKRSKGVPWICWHMDAYPQALVALAGWNPASPLYRLLHRSSGRMLRSADRVVVLGTCMQQLLHEEHGLDPESCPIIPNWCPADAVTPGPLPDTNDVLYSGNMGRGHDLDILLDALEQLPSEERPTLRFNGRGHQRESLEARCREHQLDQVHFADPVPLDQLSPLLASASVHFISQRRNTEGILVPSKLYGSLAAGRAVLFMGPEHCEVAETVRASGAGWVVAPGETQALTDRLQWINAHPEAVRDAGHRARQYHEAHGGKERALSHWTGVIEAVVSR